MSCAIGDDVFVARRHPHAAEVVAVRDRTRLAQLVPDRERVGGVLGIEVVELRGESVCAHDAHSKLTAYSGQLLHRELGPLALFGGNTARRRWRDGVAEVVAHEQIVRERDAAVMALAPIGIDPHWPTASGMRTVCFRYHRYL